MTDFPTPILTEMFESINDKSGLPDAYFGTFHLTFSENLQVIGHKKNVFGCKKCHHLASLKLSSVSDKNHAP